MSSPITLVPGDLTLRQLRRITRGQVRVELPRESVERVEACRRVLERWLASGEVVYGVNTGFGRLAHVRIAPDRLLELQRNLILSHSVGTGPFLDDSTVRLILVLKACALAQGHSGVRWQVIEALLKLANEDVLPRIPSKGSVGASGDLAPLAHMAATLIGEGSLRHDGRTVPAVEGLALADLRPLTLEPKEGVALINGTQVSTALALEGLFAAEDLLRNGIVIGAMAVDACRAADTPFDPRIHELRRQRGQQEVAAIYRALLAGSQIRQSHLDCERVQDPYSLRCQPQVMGACLDQLRHAADVLVREANAVTDNPLVFPEDQEILSGGNFHAEPVALVADGIALSIAEIGSISERRQALLVDSHLSGLPAFLTADSGLHSGFMIAHVTAAALTSENKMIAHPASVDSIPTSANQEDHVSMATHAARRLGEMADNACGILALEWLAAACGIEFHAPLRTSAPLARALRRLREVVAPMAGDRCLATDLALAKKHLLAGALFDVADTDPTPSR